MSFVSTQPEALTAAAGTLRGTGSSVSAQHAAAAAPTTEVTLATSAGSCAATEAANAIAAGRFYGG
ncbi:MAG: PE family protein [Mycobacterium sp.]|uniref:PE family protein n=1 Tax=Mycobacterium sp. TaxID=1785 RepID=UPI003F94CCA1